MVIDRDTIAAAIPYLDALVDESQRARQDIERYEFASAHGEPNPERSLDFSDSEDDARAYFAGTLTALYRALSIAMEASGIPESARRLRRQWDNIGDDVGRTEYDPHHDYCRSEGLALLQDYLAPLRAFTGQGLRNAEILRLENILRSLPSILRTEGANPDGEIALQRIAHRYLRVFYASFTTNVAIAGAVQSFRPDSGIAELRVGLEFKYADTEEKAKAAVRGILEDTAGYSGSLDWTDFIGIVYQTQAFIDEHRYRNELRRVGASTWRAIVVTKSP